MTIETKYNIGDKVYFIVEKYIYADNGEIVSTIKTIKETTITHFEINMYSWYDAPTIVYTDEDHERCIEKQVFYTKVGATLFIKEKK